MLANHLVKDRDKRSYTYRNYIIDPAHERERQAEVAQKVRNAGGFHQLFDSPDAPIVCVRGNHDFIDLRLLFGDDRVYEVVDNELLTITVREFPLRVTGHRGIPWIFGTWNDEVQPADLLDRVRAMPEADLFLTHYPPNGILDSLIPPGSSAFGDRAENVGLQGMANEIIRRVSGDYQLTDDGLTPESPVRAAHCFGHIHECGGSTLKLTDILFSNAATTYNVFDIEPLERNEQ